MAERMNTDFVLSAHDMAIGQRHPLAVAHHSDQGTQYTSIEFDLRCKKARVRPSMGTTDNAYDDAILENYIATLERALLARGRF